MKFLESITRYMQLSRMALGKDPKVLTPSGIPSSILITLIEAAGISHHPKKVRWSNPMARMEEPDK